MSDKKRSNKRKTIGQFIEEADEIHHGKYEYSKVSVENMLPICRQCNRSMGAEHMGEYVQRCYPKNMVNFKGRQYTYQKSSSANFILNFL